MKNRLIGTRGIITVKDSVDIAVRMLSLVGILVPVLIFSKSQSIQIENQKTLLKFNVYSNVPVEYHRCILKPGDAHFLDSIANLTKFKLIPECQIFNDQSFLKAANNTYSELQRYISILRFKDAISESVAYYDSLLVPTKAQKLDFQKGSHDREAHYTKLRDIYVISFIPDGSYSKQLKQLMGQILNLEAGFQKTFLRNNLDSDVKYMNSFDNVTVQYSKEVDLQFFRFIASTRSFDSVFKETLVYIQ